jgi:hypothetical protein
MSSLLVQPQLVSTAAANVADIGSTINAATAAAAGSTTGVVAAASDEVSLSAAALFDTYAKDYQALLKQGRGVPRAVRRGVGQRQRRLSGRPRRRPKPSYSAPPPAGAARRIRHCHHNLQGTD